MDRLQWNVVLQCVKVAAATLPKDKRLQFADWLVVAMFLWAVDHDRHMCWACQRSHLWFGVSSSQIAVGVPVHSPREN